MSKKKFDADKITEELCTVQPIHLDQKAIDAFNTLWDITVNQKKTIIIKGKSEDA
jgi:CO dehydrogenase/acetyl-CoA synthase delta subunit